MNRLFHGICAMALLFSIFIHASHTHEKKNKPTTKTQKIRTQKTVTPDHPLKKSDKTSASHERESDNLVLIDRIEAVVFGPEATDLITHADIQRPGIDGSQKTKEELIIDRLIFQDALKHRIMVDDKTIDDYLARIARAHNVSTHEIEELFRHSGYTVEEARRELGMLYANNEMISYQVKSQLIIPEKDVVAYWNENPLTKPATITIERAFVPATPTNTEHVRKKIETYIKTKKGLVIGWHQLPEIAEPDLAESKKFLLSLAPGEITPPQEIDGGFELFRLKSKKPEHIISLEERYREIADILRKPKAEELLEKYKKSLLASASLLIFQEPNTSR